MSPTKKFYIANESDPNMVFFQPTSDTGFWWLTEEDNEKEVQRSLGPEGAMKHYRQHSGEVCRRSFSYCISLGDTKKFAVRIFAITEPQYNGFSQLKNKLKKSRSKTPDISQFIIDDLTGLI